MFASLHSSDRSRSRVAYLKQAHQYFTELHPVSVRWKEELRGGTGGWQAQSDFYCIQSCQSVIQAMSGSPAAREHKHTTLITELYGVKPLRLRQSSREFPHHKSGYAHPSYRILQGTSHLVLNLNRNPLRTANNIISEIIKSLDTSISISSPKPSLNENAKYIWVI